MSWYRAGAVTVAAGSNVVTGAGTDFVANAAIGDAFIGQDGRSYEIGQIVSATDLRLTAPYQGAGGGGQAYAIQPTQSFARDLALAAAALLGTFAAVRDGIGQGLISSGSAAAPGIRFIADQDTGLRSGGANILVAVAGGVDRLAIDQQGRVNFLSGSRPLGPANLGESGDAGLVSYEHPVVRTYIGDGTGYSVAWAKRSGGVSTDLMTLTDAGHLLVGITSAPEHTITKSAGQGSAVLRVRSNVTGALDSFVVASVSAYTPNGAGAAVYLGHNAVTARSLNASGTVNASGADYAEYMLKAARCGIIAKGDVCGVDREGKLTTAWVDAISFVVKSTDPSYVGGDTWAAHLPPRPDAPGAEPMPPALPAVPAEGADEAEVAAYENSLAAYPTQVAQYRIDHDAWVAATAAYTRDLSAWEAQLEAARQGVDRIAFCGQVPCNVSGDFEVGDYIVAAQDGDGIKAVAMKAGAVTLSQYMARIGKVWAIRDGRAWIDVQHG